MSGDTPAKRSTLSKRKHTPVDYAVLADTKKRNVIRVPRELLTSSGALSNLLDDDLSETFLADPLSTVKLIEMYETQIIRLRKKVEELEYTLLFA